MTEASSEKNGKDTKVEEGDMKVEKENDENVDNDDDEQGKAKQTEMSETMKNDDEDVTMEKLEKVDSSKTLHLESNSDSPKMQMQLAWSLGYPSTWHVVRVYPHSATPEKLDSFMDRIYAGDPTKNVDAYFNHHAAMTAALRYEEGVSTGYENKGGQMLPRRAKFKVKDSVEVLYEDDGQWYEAEIVKVRMFLDDIRYTIYYKDEDATQNNVSESLIRIFTPKATKKSEQKKSKKRSSSQGTKKSKKAKSTKLVKGQSKITSFVKEKNQAENDIEDEEKNALALGKESGFPKGWTIRKKSGGRFDIRSPDKKRKFKTISEGLAFLSTSTEENGDAASAEEEKNAVTDSGTRTNVGDKGEDGDPPWRRVDHKYLGRFVKYPMEQNGSMYQVGKVTGWLSEKDVDADGNPGFISEKYDTPAKLFHVSFNDDEDGLLFVDLEEFELEEVLVDSNEKEEVPDKDEDDLPLSKVLKKGKS